MAPINDLMRLLSGAHVMLGEVSPDQNHRFVIEVRRDPSWVEKINRVQAQAVYSPKGLVTYHNQVVNKPVDFPFMLQGEIDIAKLKDETKRLPGCIRVRREDGTTLAGCLIENEVSVGTHPVRQDIGVMVIYPTPQAAQT